MANTLPVMNDLTNLRDLNFRYKIGESIFRNTRAETQRAPVGITSQRRFLVCFMTRITMLYHRLRRPIRFKDSKFGRASRISRSTRNTGYQRPKLGR